MTGGGAQKRGEESEDDAPPGFQWDRVDRGYGASIAFLLKKWHHWVHRRTEQVELEDPVTFRRRVSVDFTVPHELPPPASTGDDQRLYFVPLSVLSKVALPHLSVTDETGAAVPVMTRSRNGVLAASVLTALVEGTASPAFRSAYGDTITDDVERDFLTLATARRRPAWLLDRLTSGALPISGAFDADRSWAWRMEIALQLRKGDQLSRALDTFADSFLLVVPLVGFAGRRRILNFEYEQHGHRHESSVPWPVRTIGRRVVRGISGPMRMESVPDDPYASIRHDPYMRYTPLAVSLAKGLGWRPRAVTIDAPALSHGGSYHLEVAAPEGLSVTRATLSTTERDPTLLDEVRKTRQRVHLYPRRGVPPLSEGAALVTLRPHASVIVRSAWLTAIFSTAVLVLVAIRWQALVDELSATESLLLIVPALIAGYVGRAREPSVTTQVLFGLRILAVTPAVWLFLAGVVLLLGRTCETAFLVLSQCHSWHATSPAMWGLVFCSAATLFILSVTLALIERPMEQRLAPAQPELGA